MRYRPFGRTGLQDLGAGVRRRLGRRHPDPPGARDQDAAIERALDAGINWIDTAPSYGDGKSERALGWLLEDVKDRPYLSTKVRLDLSRLDDIVGQVKRSTEESLSRLRCDSVELLQLHNPIGPQTVDQLIGVDQVLGEDGVADALERMREAGPDPAHRHHRDRRYRGLPPGDRERPVRFGPGLLQHPQSERRPGHAARLAGARLRGLIAACKEHGVAVMNIRVLAAGVLATEQRHGREVQMMPEAAIPTEEARARAVWRVLDERYGTRAQTAIRFALANPDIAGVVVGLAELSHLEEALAAAEMGPLPDEALAELRALYERGFERA